VHVHLGVLVSDYVESSDDESDEMDYEERLDSPEEAMLAASTSASTSSSPEDPPQAFFDDLLARPEHVARINESGLSRATYLRPAASDIGLCAKVCMGLYGGYSENQL
jgi:hypothetical protein